MTTTIPARFTRWGLYPEYSDRALLRAVRTHARLVRRAARQNCLFTAAEHREHLRGLVVEATRRGLELPR